jgi:DNA-directed RNA polymerase specialized sigma24 family protein
MPPPRASARCRRVRLLLASLPAGQRRLLLLWWWGGLSAEDTGYVLDMSPGVVRVAQHRALLRLRALAARDVLPAREPGQAHRMGASPLPPPVKVP